MNSLYQARGLSSPYMFISYKVIDFTIGLWNCYGSIVCFGLPRFNGVYRHFQQYFSYIVAVSFIGEGNRSTRWRPPTCRKSLTNFIA